MDSSETVRVPARQKDGWLLLAVLAALSGLYLSTFQSFYHLFSKEGSGQSHAPLLLLVSLYLIYRAWSLGGRQLTLNFNRPAILALAGLSLIWLVSGLVFIEAVQQAALILIVAMAVISLLGLREGGRYLVPILLLLTLLPVWDLFIPYLQTASAKVSAFVLDLVGITSTREGYLLIIPNGTFEVADSCSGMKFEIVGITLALIHTQLIRVPVRIALGYLLAASLLAFVSNVMRIVVVVAIGYRYGMDHEYVHDHNFIGWILFSVFFFLFLFFGEKRLRHHEIGPRTGVNVTGTGAGIGRRLGGIGLIVLALAVGPVLNGYFAQREAVSRAGDIGPIERMADWQTQSRELTDWAPIWTRGDRSFEGTLVRDGEGVDLFATEFDRQSQGHEAVNLGHRVYDIEKWSRISRSVRVVELPDRGRMEVEETLLKSPGQQQRLVWQWYRTNGKVVASGARAKLNNLVGVMSGMPAISVFVLSREIIRNESHASAVMERFLQDYMAQTVESSEFTAPF